jgi:hypothetical protein
MTDFRLCLTCPSYSQADLYHYARQLISDQFESTFAHLRYFLGGDRPSQTTDHAMSELLWFHQSMWCSQRTREKIMSLRVVFQD